MYRIKKAIVISMLLCSITGFSYAAEEQFNVNLATGTPVVDALQAISLRANKNIVINGELTGTVSLNLDNTTFTQVLDYLATVNGFPTSSMAMWCWSLLQRKCPGWRPLGLTIWTWKH